MNAKSAAKKAPQPLGGKGKPAGGLSALAPRTPLNKPKPSGSLSTQAQDVLLADAMMLERRATASLDQR